MARTEILNANELTQKAWPQTMFKIMLGDMQLSKLMGEGNDMPIITDGTLRSRAGDQVIFELDMPLSNEGGTDDSDIEGNEEAMSFFNFPVIIHERSNAVRTNGLMTDKRSAINIRSKATFALGRWAGEQIENDLIWSLSGLGNQNTIIGEEVSSILTVNEKAPSTNRIFYGGQTVAKVLTEETSDSAIGDGGAADYKNYLFGTRVITAVKNKARLEFPKFKPVKVNGKWLYVMLIHPLQTISLIDETGVNGWAQIQQNANVRGDKNPLFGKLGEGEKRMFEGAIGIWDDVLLFESDRIETRVAGEVFESGDEIDVNIVSGTARIARALLLGAQAGVVGWGKAWQRRERQFDYKRKTGTATDALYGASKVRFNDPGNEQSVNTAQEDFAVFVVDTAVTEA